MNKKILSKLIKLNTVSSNSNLELIDFVQKQLVAFGYRIKIMRRGNKADLFAYKKLSPRIILAAHSDTVPPSGQWSSDPFRLTSVNGKYVGLGVSDMKTFIALMLDVARHFSRINNLAFLITFDEEVDFGGADLVDKSIIGKSDVVIIGEPTNNKIILNTKGVVAGRVEFTGIGGHGSEPFRGVSAIEDAAIFIHLFKEIYSGVSKKHDNLSFAYPSTTINFGTIAGGQAINKIAEKAVIQFETRINYLAQLDEIRKIISIIQKKLKSQIIFSITFLTKPFYASDKLYELFKKEKIEISLGVSYTTEASCFQKLSPNIVIFGPGNIKQAHRTSESISVTAIDRYKKKLVKILLLLSSM